jgi:TM2 domain-containing membrane protein YozV
MNQDRERRSPGLAAVLSFIFNGLGQLYNGEIRKGLTIIFFSAVSLLVFIIGSVIIGFWILGRISFGKELVVGLILFCVGLIAICVLGIYSIIDAFKVAKESSEKV